MTWFIVLFSFDLPAWVLLVYWIGLQFLSGFGSIADVGSQRGGVAYFDFARDAGGRIMKLAREGNLAVYYGYDAVLLPSSGRELSAIAAENGEQPWSRLSAS